jgi:hypothetical protein
MPRGGPLTSTFGAAALDDLLEAGFAALTSKSDN